MALRRNKVYQPFDGTVEKLGSYHHTDAKNDSNPLSPCDAEAPTCRYHTDSGNEVKTEVLLFAYATTDTFPGIAEAA